MPTINGITASINTHDGALEEFDVDEFPGGVSCFIIAHSGQQFWLNYSIEHPIRAKAVSVEFHVDGHRIDTQFPLAVEGDGPPSVGPVKSSITSQYGKDDAGNVYRRDVFFTLVDKVKHKNPRSASALVAPETAGTIECKVYRAEKTGEWNGTISPDKLPVQGQGGPLRKKGVSHTARLGASIPAAKTVRYTFKNLDPEDEPFAFFRFYYRSKKFVQRSRLGNWSLSRPSSPVQIPRPLSRSLTRKSSLYQSLTRGKEFLADKLTSRQSESSELMRVTSPDPIRSSSSLTVTNIEATIQRLESDLALAGNNPEDAERVQILRSKLEQLKQDPVLQSKTPPKEPKGKDPEYRVVIEEEEGSSPKEKGSISDGRSTDLLGDSHNEPKAEASG
ncbi:hypothetical protein BDD12DRAFT_880355 [Trichophaea hybrida]|nr:hypothetical protein BDD12DRAFT_880355 [Trichophaea hybrida]